MGKDPLHTSVHLNPIEITPIFNINIKNMLGNESEWGREGNYNLVDRVSAYNDKIWRKLKNM